MVVLTIVGVVNNHQFQEQMVADASAEDEIFQEIRYGYCENRLNVRQQMSVDSKWISQYPAKSTIVLLEELDGWYRVENGYVKAEFVYDEVEIYKPLMFNMVSIIYTEADVKSGIYGVTNIGAETNAIRKRNGFVELQDGGWVSENSVTFLDSSPLPFATNTVNVESTYTSELFFEEQPVHDEYEVFEPETFVLEEYVPFLSVEDFYVDNMINLPIKYIGTLAKRTSGQSVTRNGSLSFKGDIPIYDIIDGYAYFPSGRRIFKISADKFLNIQNVGANYEILDAYRTVYHSSASGRKANIELVSAYLDGTVIESGATFSYNKTTGPRSASRGYQLAPVIVNGEYVDDYGGGVCQVSSTIYAAVMSDEYITIKSRKQHGLEVTYLPYGMDATVSYGSIDLKFENNYPFDIVLNVISGNGACLVTITRAE